MSKICVVFGATGNQGGSVINAVLRDPILKDQYRIRAITRNASKPAAVTLSEKGVEVFQADLTDLDSIRRAMVGAHTIFAMTETIHDDELLARDTAHGRALVDAAVAAEASFYIYSTLPGIKKLSGGKYTQGEHFDAKAEVEEYIRRQPIRSAFVAPRSFMSVFLDIMAPVRMEDGTYALMNMVTPQTQFPLLDTAGDIGKFVALMLATPEKFEGKVIPAATKLYTFEEITQVMSSVSGKAIIYVQQPPEVMKKFLPKHAADRFIDMMLFIQDFGYYGSNTPRIMKEAQGLSPSDLTTFEDFLRQKQVYTTVTRLVRYSTVCCPDSSYNQKPPT